MSGLPTNQTELVQAYASGPALAPLIALKHLRPKPLLLVDSSDLQYSYTLANPRTTKSKDDKSTQTPFLRDRAIDQALQVAGFD